MNISAWSIRNPLPTILLFTILTGLGLVGYSWLPISYFPTIIEPTVSVSIEDAGTSPQQIESAITRRVEDALANLPGIKEISSVVEEGYSLTNAEFDLGVSADRALSDVRDAISGMGDSLPARAGEPVIRRERDNNGPIATYAVTDRSMTAAELSWFVDDVVLRRMRGLPGIGDVERAGGVDREIQILLDPHRLTAAGITASGVNAQLRTLAMDGGAGSASFGATDRAISIHGSSSTVDALAATPIVLSDGSQIRLEDIGRVVDAHAEPKAFAMLDGRATVALTIGAAEGASEVAVGDAVNAAIQLLASEHPQTRFERIDDSAAYTLGNYDAAIHTLFEGAALAVVVVFIFLRNWRATIVAAIAMPLSAIPTFFMMDLLGFSLNIISLLAITLVSGILVDDAIVEIENIEQHLHAGKDPRRAALDASAEIGLAVMAISATIIAVFLPVGFIPGVVGQYFREFGLTVAIAVFFSLMVARMITPLLAAHFMRAVPQRPHRVTAFGRAFAGLLETAVRWRWLTCGLSIVLFLAAMAGAARLPAEFLPFEDNDKIQISVELPAGSTLGDMHAAATAISDGVRTVEGVRQVYVRGGADHSGVNEIRRAAVLVTLLPKAERSGSSLKIGQEVGEVLRTVPDVRFEILNSRGGRDVEVSVLGRNSEQASAAADALMQELQVASFAVAPTSSEARGRPELTIRPLADRLADAGVTTQAIAETVRVSTVGASDSELPEFIDGERRIPIRVQIGPEHRGDIEAVGQLRVALPNGETVPLSQIAEIEADERVSRIERKDRERQIDIGFDVAPGSSAGQGLDAIRTLPAAQNLPDGVRLVASGDSDTQGEMFSGFALAMAAGITLVLVILILLFNSVMTPLTILVTMPLSAGGVVAALFLTGTALSLTVVIGILMLMGIVTKNAIMLVDFAIEREARGMSRLQAVVEASRMRARPIAMTTLAMVAGMVPAALGVGEGGALRAPMAIAVIGGLVTSTALSLIVVPAFHCVMGDIARLGSLARRSKVLPETNIALGASP